MKILNNYNINLHVNLKIKNIILITLLLTSDEIILHLPKESAPRVSLIELKRLFTAYAYAFARILTDCSNDSVIMPI